jgi:hypothetical protein
MMHSPSDLSAQKRGLAMWTPSDLMEGPTGPLIDPARPEERSRLALLSQLVPVPLAQIAERLPARAGFRQVLDLASGPGGWALEVAGHFPRCHVTGVDRCHPMIEAARAQAARKFLTTVSFVPVDVLQRPWPFPDQRFDLVNAQFLASFLPGPQSWRPLLHECVRLTRPGGVIRLVECIEGEANSAACHTLCLAHQQALVQAAQRSALPYAFLPQCMVWLDGLLAEAGCDPVERKVTRIAWTMGDGQGRQIAGVLLLTLRLLQPFLLEQGVISEAEFEQAYRALADEMACGLFAGSWRIQVSTGVVPRERPVPLREERIPHWKGRATTQMRRTEQVCAPEGADQ